MVATSEIQLATHYKRYSGNTVLSLIYDHPQNHIGVVVKERWSSARTWIFYNMCTPEHTCLHSQTIMLTVLATGRGKRSDQSATMSSRTSALSQNSVRWPRFQQHCARINLPSIYPIGVFRDHASYNQDPENSIWPGRWSRLRDGRRSGTAETENSVRHTKSGRIRGMLIGEGGRFQRFYCSWRN